MAAHAAGRPRPVRDALLAEAKKQRRAAGQKAYRLRQRGIDTSSIDPRADASALSAMSPRQLRAQIARDRAFTSRTNAYVPGLKGAPLSAATWREYRRAEQVRNENSARFYESIKDLPVRGLGQTVEERLNNLARNKSAFGDYFSFARPDKNGNYPERNASNITGQAGLKQLIEQMNRRNDPRYLEREAKLTRQILNKMLARTNNKDLIPLLGKATDEELITLTQYMGFTKILESSYAMSKSVSSDTPEWQSSVYEDNEDTLRDWAEWVSRHFSDQDTTEISNDDGRAEQDRRRRTPQRDKYGRFISRSFKPGVGAFNPDYGDGERPAPVFNRDSNGRFAPGRGKFNPKLK